MQSSSVADIQRSDMGQPTKCASLGKPTEAERHRQEVLRYVLVGVALLAVLLLIAIAFYYTEGNSLTVKHVSSLRPYLSVRAGA
jgi:hypothetical protein